MRGLSQRGTFLRCCCAVATALVSPAVVAPLSTVAAAAGGDMGQCAPKPMLNVLTWNIAAINNNPFEYWITYSDPN